MIKHILFLNTIKQTFGRNIKYSPLKYIARQRNIRWVDLKRANPGSGFKPYPNI